MPIDTPTLVCAMAEPAANAMASETEIARVGIMMLLLQGDKDARADPSSTGFRFASVTRWRHRLSCATPRGTVRFYFESGGATLVPDSYQLSGFNR
jgi:hypothetical protein